MQRNVTTQTVNFTPVMVDSLQLQRNKPEMILSLSPKQSCGSKFSPLSVTVKHHCTVTDCSLSVSYFQVAEKVLKQKKT